MRLQLAGSFVSFLGILGLVILTQTPVAAQYSQQSLATRYDSGWESDRVRVRTISVEPGAQALTQDDADRVLVYLTADVQGRMPQAEAIWQPAGTGKLENRGKLRMEAVLIELKDAPTSAVGVTPPEALPGTDAVDVRLLIDNARVIVTKQRYSPNAYAGPWHFHPQDAIIVYLRGGYTWLPYARGGPYRVNRGDFDVLPANTFHTFSNAGGDPLEFLVIFPK